MTNSKPSAISPREPESLEETGIPETLIEHLIFKILYFRGELYGQDLSAAIGLRFSVIQGIVEPMLVRHQIQVKRSLGMGIVGSVFALTEAGRARAREYLDANQYAGVAPVPLGQYVEVVRRQKPAEGWLTKESLRKALSSMVVTEHLLSQVGPAVSAANSLLIYGKPGDGKTFLVESLNNIEAEPVFVPYAIECQGNIIQVYDPIYHERIEEEPPSVLSVSVERSHDRRWIKCKRPFIVSGGELALDMLDLRYNQTSKVYEAPFQMKANNGIYLVDDFGRQRATPAEVLNRWIVPMERRVDYLSFLTGGKVTAPFEVFLVFSTNLNPADLGDEAFLRRMQYKMLLRGPGEAEFVRIFENFCAAKRLPYDASVIERFVEKRYRQTGKPFRRCQPRDVLSHALNLIRFEKLPFELNDEVLDRAFESCFLQEQDDAPAAEIALAAAPVKSCANSWGDKLSLMPTAFGSLVYFASFRDTVLGDYADYASAREYGAAETSRTLARLHAQTFREWLSMEPHRQNRDLACYLASGDGAGAKAGEDHAEQAARLTPPEASAEERWAFARGLSALLTKPATAIAEVGVERVA